MIAVVASLFLAAAAAAGTTPVHQQERNAYVSVLYTSEPSALDVGDRFAETHIGASTLRSRDRGGAWTEETIWTISQWWLVNTEGSDGGIHVRTEDVFFSRSDQALSTIEPATLTIKGRHSAHLVGTFVFERGTLHVDLALTAAGYPDPGHDEDAIWSSRFGDPIGDVTLNGDSLLYADSVVDEANLSLVFRH